MCDQCSQFQKEHPTYQYCPCCGTKLLTLEEVKKAVNILIDYCASYDSCSTCIFCGPVSGKCCFDMGDIPAVWCRR